MPARVSSAQMIDASILLPVLLAFRKGDHSVRMPVEATGMLGKVSDTLNEIIDLQARATDEFVRVGNMVGKEGKVRGRASMSGAVGGWATQIDAFNGLVGDLVAPTTEIARVVGAVARGDLGQQMSIEFDGTPLRGEFLRTARTVNTMVDQLSSFASEVTRVAREVGSEGRLGGQAIVKGVSGTWKDLTDSVNSMASNLTDQVRNIAQVTTAVANGDLSQKITVDVRGEFLQLKETTNTMVDQLGSFASEVTRVAREVGSEGKLGGQAVVKGVSGTWKDLTDSVNFMAANLTGQVRNIAQVTTAVARGDLSRKITAEAQGEILELTNTINTMVDQLGSFASEVTRVAREVGTEGKLGGQADVKGVSGTWRDLTDNVNSMAANLTGQVRNIAQVTTAVANGDLSQTITVEARGEILELKRTINTMVDQLSSFAAEVTRVAREVGSEGKLGGQADVKGVSGTWRDLTDNVNSMAANLTGQVRNIADVTTAVANGDLSQKITADARGEILELKNTINTMVDQLGSFASEVTRVAREVGTEGMLGGQAVVKGVSGTWKDLTDSVNSMASNLTGQVRNIAGVTTAVANGDLSQKITVDVRGEFLELKRTINTMVDQLSSFAAEVTRVAREVGTEGMLGGQADVQGVSGTWKDLTDSVNSMASNLTGQVRNIADVTTAVANGDLSRKITAEAQGEILELKNTVNTMVDQLSSFASEVTRVAREVGSEGRLGGQAIVKGVSGTWKDLTDSVNFMAANLTGQVRNIADVTTAVANGDLSRKITAEAQGEILELTDTINTMVDQLSSFAAEVTRVAREVGSEGRLGGQADVAGVSGTWRDLTDSVNFMAANLTDQVRNIAQVTTAVANGDLSQKITAEAQGEILELTDTINTMVDQLSSFASEVTRVAREVGTEGRLGGQAVVKGVSGTWKDLTDSVNSMAANLTDQVRNIAQVTTAVANGDLSQKITVDARGEILELKNTVNTMVDQLSSFAAEVTRVAREVGTEGMLGGQAIVKGVSGTWKDLTDSVNSMASNLTGQVRNIARVVTAVANGDLRQSLVLEARGEIAELADTINGMIETLATFGDQVSNVAREVGVEGKLGGQANVPGAAGLWRNLTDNVNRLAANLTTQVRAIADVSTAVTQGDLTRSITVEAFGEVAALKDNVNEMIRNLRDTTQRSAEQDWLKTNLARFTRMLQGQRDLMSVTNQIMSELAPLVNSQHGVFYLVDSDNEADTQFKLFSSYAYRERKHLSSTFRLGEGLVGQAALEKQRILITEVPEDYVKVNSGLGEATPRNIVVLPITFEDKVKGVMELASFSRFTDTYLSFLDQLVESVGIVINTIEANSRTEELLKQSQSLTFELQQQQQELRVTNERLEEQARTLQTSEERLREQQEELQQTNEELEERSGLLAQRNDEVERKNREVEEARTSLEEKAEQLALSSKYKSEFLANMSHELRTPLNSMLILSKMLADNPDANLTDKQVEYAQTIHGSGADLLELINDILDLSKIESGMMQAEVSPVRLAEFAEYVDRGFRETALVKGLTFTIELGEGLPDVILTDEKRFQQVVKNLLSNAFKFTEHGGVALRAAPATSGWSHDHARLNAADRVVGVSVTDTGIGIARDKQKIIFEAFQQADGTTSRRYGGTGLGLSISRSIADLLGGEIRLESEPGVGSTFTLYLPIEYRAPAPRPEAHSAGASIAVADPVPSATSAAVATGDPAAPMQAMTPIDVPVPGPVLEDDRAAIEPGDRVLLVVEDDLRFASILVGLARERGFKVIVADLGEAGLALARRFKPDAITLDIRLPDLDGWAVLDRIKHDQATRHIPVHVITVEDDQRRAVSLGAIRFLRKPADADVLGSAIQELREFVERPVRRLLVVEDDEKQRVAIKELIGNGDVTITAVASGEEALAALSAETFDCMVLDLALPDMSGFQLIDRLKALDTHSSLPIVIYTGRELSRKEEAELRRAARSVVVKDVRSPERLLAETALFLHRVETNLPEPKRRMLQRVYENDPQLSGRTVLVIDDDMRNVYALSAMLERYSMNVVYAENGREGLALLASTPAVHAVLCDVMMPEMDGYEVMREIRRQRKWKNLPVIALTAKAMKGDRGKCIAAGASDYIAKPVDMDQLLSLLRVWLYK